MRKTCLQSVYELAKQDERIVFIGSDLGAGVLEDFKREMPERFFMEGVGEANMVGMAAGMALSGKIVYCHTIATFLTRRAFEQVAIDVGLHRANVRLIGAGGGAVYAPLGPTHLAVDDIALMRTIPGMTILSPCDAVEMANFMPHTVNHQGPIYIRLGRGGDPVIAGGKDYQYDVTVHGAGDDVALISTGTTSQIACEAMRQSGINARCIHVPVLKPLNARLLIELIHRLPLVITIEDHSINGGLGTMIAELIATTCQQRPRLCRIGYPDCFPSGYGTQDEMRARYGISVENIVRTVKELCGE